MGTALIMALIGGIPTILGIIGVIVAYKYNPRRAYYAELDAIFKQWEALNGKMGEALAKNDSDVISVVTDQLNKLRARKAILLKRVV